MCSGSATWPAAPLSMALRGMPSKRALSGRCTSTRAPASRRVTIPREPSLPVPESTTPTAALPASRARERKKVSMGRWICTVGSLSLSSSRPLARIICLRGGIT
jgi:hypothetical protein